MSREILPILAELLQYGQAPISETKAFVRNGWKHNDVLCPWLKRRLEEVRDCFLKFQSSAYDVQGMHDLGTDVLVKYMDSGDVDSAKYRYIAFQIKSDEDLAKSECIKDVRAQCFQAHGEFGDQLDCYYIMLCGDAEKYRNRIREISKTVSTHNKVVLITPEFALRFLLLRRAKLWSVIDTFFREDDEVLKEAKALVEDLSPTQAATAIAAIHGATYGDEPTISLDEMSGDPFLQRLYDLTPDVDQEDLLLMQERRLVEVGKLTRSVIDDIDDDYEPEDRERSFDDRWQEDLSSLTDRLIRLGDYGDRVHVDLAYGRPLQALLIDADVRYGYRGQELKLYVLDLLAILDRYGLEIQEQEPA